MINYREIFFKIEHAEQGRCIGIKPKILVFIFSILLFCLGSTDVSAAANWYKYGPVIHACGKYHGYTYTNSREALLNTLKKRKFQKKLPIEIDFMLTSDGVPVCVHDWGDFNRCNKIRSNRRMSLKEFKKRHTLGKNTPMTAIEAINIMEKTGNAYLVIDTKETGLKIYRKLVYFCKKTGHSSFLNRMIVQLYHFEDYKKIHSIYPFKHWVFSAYKVGCKNPGQIKNIIKKVQALRLDALVMPYTSFAIKKNSHYVLHSRNIKAANTNRRVPLIVHTINNKNYYKTLKKFRINEIYTDDVNMR